MKTKLSKKKREPALPTPSQIKWADAEIGVIIHFDMQVFEPNYDFRRSWGYTPDLAVFNPPELNTDQWIETAKSAGAKYAVLVAKHCSGFSLWPTKAHDYHIGNTPWKNGNGDIVADFIKSCKKFDIKPGIYASASCNGYLRVDNPGKVLINDPAFLKKYSENIHMQSGQESVWADQKEQLHYNKVVETQLTELWNNYGKLFEIWFDGGVLPPEQGGPDIVPIMHQLQSDAVVFGGPQDWPSLARFIGNERAKVPDPFWSTTDNQGSFDGTTEFSGLGGNPNSSVWAPGEADMPNRTKGKAFQGGWFWRAGEDDTLYSVDHLTECYFSSVGRNTNLLLGMVIDNRGLIPNVDKKQFAEFGKRIQNIFSNCRQSVSGNKTTHILEVPTGNAINMVVLQENIEYGERVRKYVVEAEIKDRWIEVCRGTCIGHKRIERFNAVETDKFRLRILESTAEPQIREFSVWDAAPTLFNVSMDPVERNTPQIIRSKDGMIHIACPNPNLHIKYSVNGEPESEDKWIIYKQPFPLANGGMIKAFAFVNHLSHSETVTAIFGIDRQEWTIVSTSMESPFKNGGYADVSYLLNDDPNYYWHTYHSNKNKSVPPHEVVFDMKQNIEVKAFTLMPRDAENIPLECDFYLSNDGESWELSANAIFDSSTSNTGMRLIKAEQKKDGRFLRFVVKRVPEIVDCVIVAGIGVILANKK